MHRSISLLATLLLFATTNALAQSSAGDKIYQAAKTAGVEVSVDGHLSGSGWFTDKAGWAMTAAHVVEKPGRSIQLLSPPLGRLTAEVAAVDLGHDLVLLKAELGQREAPFLTFADRLPRPGGDVYCFGAPLYRHKVMLPGKIASETPAFEFYEEHYVEITHFAAMSPGGMSGGPWLDEQGHVLGAQSGVMSHGGLPLGVSFVTPLAATRALAERKQSTATATLGAAVEELWQQDGKLLGRYPPDTEGLVVVRLQDDGPAARAGLKKDDLIVAAGGSKIRLIDELQRVVVGKHPGDSVELSIQNPDGAGDRKITVKLGSLETAWPKAAGERAATGSGR